MDNLSTDFTPKVEAFLDQHPRVFLRIIEFINDYNRRAKPFRWT